MTIKYLIDQLNVNRSSINYNIIGYGDLEQEIRNKIVDLQLSDVIKIIIKPKNLRKYYVDADIFFSSSLFEGMSNSIMEALSFSLPVVSTNVGDVKFLVQNNKNGFLCSVKDKVNMADSLQKLILSKELRIKFGLKSYNIISKNFSMQIFRKKYIEFINKMIQ